MRINVLVKANARKDCVEELPTGEWRVSVSAPAQEGRANEAVARALGKHFDVPPSRVRILLGDKSKKKLVEILD